MRRETTPSRITVVVCVPMSGVGGFARRNGVPCDLWQFCLRLSFDLGGAAVVVSSLIGTVVSTRIYISRGFDPRVGFPLVRCF